MKKTWVMVLGIVFSGAIGLLVMYVVNTSHLLDTYEQAVMFVDSGAYDEAKELFEDIKEKEYHDTAAYISLCEAHIAYEKGYIRGAYSGISDIRFNHLSDEQEKVVNQFVETIKAEYDVYMKEKAEADEKAFRDRIANGVPYVGMPESEIYNTSLGSPSIDVRHNTEFVRGKRCTANIYDFMRDNARIFTARCVEGTVIQVWDYRNDPIRPYIPKKSTTTDKEDDPYDVNDYSNEEDFYYDHYDDFFDYYDAEDYYDEHHQ